MRADQDFDVDSEIVRPPENLDYSPGGPIVVIAEVENLGGDDHAVQVFGRIDRNFARADAMHIWLRRRQLHPFRNFDPLANAIVMRDHVISTPSNAKLAHDRRMGALHYLHNFAMRAAVALDTFDADGHAVAIHGTLGVFLVDVNIAAQSFDRLIWNHEAVAVPMHAEPPVDCL